ncbi:lisH domain-containing protein ARMC9-like isoform X3 [Acanthaster planci]|uniref:LisH domain-containing protein ARMC9 n=1 Tax=Acanthaster planci TaxID=133434 RepID=A0A8B7YBV1_ACAPL|nr:lisH domain-containing protein ARMC9-like isoform X3 [Acanthaster planci]
MMGSNRASGNTLVAFEDDLNSIVKEYLEFCSFKTTLKSFESEARERGKHLKPLPKRPWDMKKKDLQSNLLSLFKAGSRKEFFQLWDENIPESVKANDPVCKKLEFYLSIYFAIYPIKYQLTTGKKSKIKVEDSMLAFKTFLESRGAVLSQTTEFLPFYALPFVPDPTKHPSYKELFQDSWVPDLQIRLEKFLMLTLPAHPQPRLFEIYQDLNNKNAEQMNQIQQNLVEAEKRCMTYIKRYNKLQADYHNLIGITAELVDSLESCINGDPVTPEYLQTVCQRLFSNQLRESVDVNRPSTAGEMFRASFAPPSKEDVPLLPSLDYERVKNDMINAPSRQRELLLQALRWRLTRSEPGEQRDTVLAAYIQHDLLGCAEDTDHRDAVMDSLKSGDEVTQQYMARLFNAFASLSSGRNYLGKNENLVSILQMALQSEDKDPITRENVLGALQKLSLKRHLQTSMINAGIIKWLISVLEDSDSLSDYTLEYSVALLMNLCLRTAGKTKCISDKANILKVLSDLLGHEDQEIRPYVNGTLYSILSVQEIREEAKAMGMEETLKCFIKEDTPEMNRQIHFIIKQLNTDVVTEDVESDDEEEEEEGEEDQDQDAMEADLDKAEAIKAKPGELAGEKLLSTEYLGMLTNAQYLCLSEDKGAAMDEKPFSRPESERQSATTSVQRSAASERHSAVDVSDGQNIPVAGSKSNEQVVRPPTRSGSHSSQHSHLAVAAAGDSNELELDKGKTVSRETVDNKTVRNPSTKPVNSANGPSSAKYMSEYELAFASRPKIPRDSISSKGRPSSRGMTPPPAPKASGSPPLSRPNTGGSRQTKTGSRSDARNTSLPPVENVELDYQALNRPRSSASVLSVMSSVSLHIGSGSSDHPSREPSGLASVKNMSSLKQTGSGHYGSGSSRSRKK